MRQSGLTVGTLENQLLLGKNHLFTRISSTTTKKEREREREREREIKPCFLEEQ